MMKTIEKALFVAENDTRRRKSATNLRQMESRLIKNILVQSLAVEIIRNSQKPSSELLKELINIETQAGNFVGQAFMEAGSEPGEVDLKGVLASALSFIPFRPFGQKLSSSVILRKIALKALDHILPYKLLPQGNDFAPLLQSCMLPPEIQSGGSKQSETRLKKKKNPKSAQKRKNSLAGKRRIAKTVRP